MQVVYHIGAHCTDEDRLLKVLLKNRDLLSPKGIIVPGPGRYRKLIQKTIRTLKGASPTRETQEALLDSIVDEDDIKRLILSGQDFFAFAPWVFNSNALYDNASEHIRTLSDLLPDASVEFFIGLRNPATFIPAVFSKTKDLSFLDFLRGFSPYDLHWSDLVQRIREAAPDVPLTVWCNEDTPLIWSRLLSKLTGLDTRDPFAGEPDFLAEIMDPEGLNRYLDFLETNPPQNESQKCEILIAFLDKFAISENIEEELDLPGWTDELVEALTENYEDDVQDIQHIPGVTFINP